MAPRQRTAAAAPCGFQMAALGWIQPYRPAPSPGCEPGPPPASWQGVGGAPEMVPRGGDMARVGVPGASPATAGTSCAHDVGVLWGGGKDGGGCVPWGLVLMLGGGSPWIVLGADPIPASPPFSQPAGRRSRTARATSPRPSSPTGTLPTCTASGGSPSPPERRYHPPSTCACPPPPPPPSSQIWGPPTSPCPAAAGCWRRGPGATAGTAARSPRVARGFGGGGLTPRFPSSPPSTSDHPEFHHPGPLPKPAVLVRLRGGERRVLEKGHAAR